MKVEIIKVEDYPNCKKITVKAVVDGKEHTQRFSVSPKYYDNDGWKGFVRNWIESIKIKGEIKTGKIRL